MSIWCSWETIGWDDLRGVTVLEGGNEPREGGVERTRPGEVRSYATGWGNHHPTLDVETPANVDIAHIPEWCVPGHRDGEGDYGDGGPIGAWLRLGVYAEDFDLSTAKPTGKHTYTAVVMDEDAVRELVADLTRWLAVPKVHPTEEDPR